MKWSSSLTPSGEHAPRSQRRVVTECEGTTGGSRRARPIRVAVCYRVVPHWRKPVFDRLAARGDVDLRVFYGQDITGAKHRSAPGLSGPEWRCLRSVPIAVPTRGEIYAMPLSPGLPLALL